MSAPTSPAHGPWQSARRLSDRTPMRVKLITAVLTLVAIALVTISIAGLGFLRSFLLGQADNSLAGVIRPTGPAVNWVQSYLETGQVRNSEGPFAVGWLPLGASSPAWVAKEPNVYGLNSPGTPVTFKAPPTVRPGASWLSSDEPVTIGATSGGGRFRVVAVPLLSSNGQQVVGHVIVSLDVTSVYQTLGKLTGIDIIISSILLTAIAVLGVAVIRASLRPLTDIEKTAEAIAGGELSRRVPDHDPRTEVGRLGRSLNTMLTQIETAFVARSASETAARKSEDRMRQFVADASHELRTPLTAIRGFAEYYRQRGGVDTTGRAGIEAARTLARAQLGLGTGRITDPETAEPGGPDAADGSRSGLAPAELDRIMRRVEQESSRMGVLVEDMLLLARLDQQRPLEHRTVDLLTLAADAVHDARVVAPDRNINLTVGAGAALLVLGDEVRLRQVIGNLMSNAMAHTPGGTPIDVRIRSGSLDEARSPGRSAAIARPGAAAQPIPLGQPIPLRQPAGPGQPAIPDQPVPPSPPGAAGPPGAPALAAAARPRSAAVLEVTDHGPGLSQDQAERVFERFYRGDQARTSGGSGLGLAIVASLVAAHGGAVWVESAPGAGATFRIALPLAPEAMHDDADDLGEPAFLAPPTWGTADRARPGPWPVT
jgi:two-component system, OmpR family, sensor kinase